MRRARSSSSREPTRWPSERRSQLMLRIETFIDKPDRLGEGPLWDAKDERFYWIDSYGLAVHRADIKGGDRKTWKVPEPIGSMALREKGGSILALRSGFHSLDFNTGE